MFNRFKRNFGKYLKSRRQEKSIGCLQLNSSIVRKHAFQSFFKKGEKVVSVGLIEKKFDRTNIAPRDIVISINRFVNELNNLRERGINGVFFVSNNQALIKSARKKCSSIGLELKEIELRGKENGSMLVAIRL